MNVPIAEKTRRLFWLHPVVGSHQRKQLRTATLTDSYGNFGLTAGRVAAWTGTRRISSPPTSQGPPGNLPAGISFARRSAAGRSCPGRRS